MLQILNSLFCVFFFAISFGQTSWELKKQEEGIRVYTKKLEGYSVNAYEAVMEIPATKNQVLTTILDGDNLYKWTYQTETSNLLQRVNDSTYLVYMYNDFPWPVKNRDHISELIVLDKGEEGCLIEIASLPSSLEEKESTIRLKKFEGYWLIEPSKKGYVLVTQQLVGEPEGYLPNFIVNTMLIKAPFETFRNLKEYLATK